MGGGGDEGKIGKHLTLGAKQQGPKMLKVGPKFFFLGALTPSVKGA
jgi:hypothetical protein